MSLLLVGCQVLGVAVVLLFELAGRREADVSATWFSMLPAIGIGVLVAAPFLALLAVAWGARVHRPALLGYAAATALLVLVGVVATW